MLICPLSIFMVTRPRRAVGNGAMRRFGMPAEDHSTRAVITQGGVLAVVRDPMDTLWEFAWAEVKSLPWLFWGGMTEGELVELHAEADRRLT